MRINAEPAFVLHQRPFRETSLLVDIFSCHYGKMRLVAKGARVSKHGKGRTLQPFRLLRVAWVGKNELKTLTSSEEEGNSYLAIGNDLITEFYLNELLIRLLPPTVPMPQLFISYQRALAGVCAGNIELALRVFERDLLIQLGYGISFDRGPDNHPICSDKDYFYHPVHGLSFSEQHAGEIRIRGVSLQSLQQGVFLDNKARQEIKYLMQRVLQQHLGNKPLHSRMLYQSYISGKC